MAVGPDGLDWDFIRQYAALSSEKKAAFNAALAAQNQPGQRFVPTVVDGQIVIPSTGVPRTDNPLYQAPGSQAQKPAPDYSAAVAQTDALLRLMGLQDLIPEVESLVRSGATPQQIENMLYDPSTAIGKKLDQLYPEVRETRENGLPPINVQNVLDARTQARQVVNQLGVQDAFPDLNSVVRSFITKGKSISELQNRLVAISDAVTATAASDPLHQQELAQWEQFYGVKPTKGELVAMAINPQFTVAQLQDRATAVGIGAQANVTGFGAIDRAQAEQIAAGGYTGETSRDQFSQLAGLAPALGDLTGQQVDVVDPQAQIEAAFSGNANAARRIAKRQREQVGAFSGGGGFASSSQGFSGVGSATSR